MRRDVLTGVLAVLRPYTNLSCKVLMELLLHGDKDLSNNNLNRTVLQLTLYLSLNLTNLARIIPNFLIAQHFAPWGWNEYTKTEWSILEYVKSRCSRPESSATFFSKIEGYRRAGEAILSSDALQLLFLLFQITNGSSCSSKVAVESKFIKIIT